VASEEDDDAEGATDRTKKKNINKPQALGDVGKENW
jgi:hypothetical protein